MKKSFCRLLILVNHALVANLNIANMSLMPFAKIKFSRKFPDLHYAQIRKLFEHKIVNIFLPSNLNMCFGVSH